MPDADALYGLSRSTLYRGLRQQPRPKPLYRADRGRPKAAAAAAELERWCETIAAMKLRTLNDKGRHLSTAGAIRILEEYGGHAGRPGPPAAGLPRPSTAMRCGTSTLARPT